DVKSLDLRISMPAGVLPAERLSTGFESRSRELALKLSTVRGRVDLLLTERAIPDLRVSARLFHQGRELDTQTVQLFPGEINAVGKQGGEAFGLLGRVRVHFPDGALGEDAQVRIRSLPTPLE